jgi:hypothetical protein
MKNVAIFYLALIFAGCASTRLSTFKDPKYQNRSYSSFVVMSDFADIEDKKYFESKLSTELSKVGINSKRGIDVILPTREYSSEDFGRAIVSTEAEALIFVNLTDSYSTSTYVPPSYNTTGAVSTFGNHSYLNSTTSQSGGYNINKPVEEYEILVVDLSTWEKVLVSSGVTRGNAFANSKDLLDSLARKIVKVLLQERVLKQNMITSQER